MKILAKIIIVVAIFFVGFYIGQQQATAPGLFNNQLETLEQSQEQIKVSLMLDFGNGEIKTFDNVQAKKGSSVFELLEKITSENEVELQYKDYGGDLGVFIESIGGAISDFEADRYWQFWVNNEYAQVGASNHELSDGDVVEWKYAKGQLK